MTTVLAVVLLAITAFGVFAIAAGAIGREARRLDALPPRKTFVLDDAVAFVADRLPEDLTGQLAYDDVRRIVLAHVDTVERRGVQFETVHDADDIVVGPEITDEVAIALGPGSEISREEVGAVLDQLIGYYAAIGAVGPPADPETDP
jgi:hypothetical protein